MSADSELSSSGAQVAKYGPADWDAVRRSFATSIMVDTALSSLAQNLDMPDWPFKGPTETPSKYIDLSYEELSRMPGFSGQTARIDQLVSILKETLAFDEPFGDMVADSSKGSDKDNPILKNLNKLGISEDFPMALVALTAETREFCTLEKLATLKEFAIFAQNMAQSVIVGGDFRALLNALSHIDESTLAMYLPYRPGAKGLHLIEGLALAVRAYPSETRCGLAKAFGARLGAEDAAAADTASQLEVEGAGKVLAEHTASYIEYFQTDLAHLQAQVNEGIALGRLATVLNDPVVESVVTSLIKPYLAFPTAKAPARVTTPPLQEEAPRRGFFGFLSKLFKK
jgi:hypothetical protein